MPTFGVGVAIALALLLSGRANANDPPVPVPPSDAPTANETTGRLLEPPAQLQIDTWTNPASDRLVLEGAAAVALGAIWWGLAANHSKWARTGCPCTPDQVNPFDRIAVRSSINKRFELVADITVGTALALPFLVAATVAPNWQDALADSTVVAQSMFATGVATQIAKGVFSRPYPYLHGPAPYPQQNDDPINYASMWSGHTAIPMAGAVTLAVLLSKRFPESKWKWLAWAVGPTLAVSGGILQIAAANHYPTDVMVGAAAGAGAGMLNGWLHRW